uniref:hypothetical protein n=1 Tax=Scandinavium goeteborgense TaxID=1851514 RepID=UPI001358BDB8|nr:hypothetical protein [Scandinavium goeteborgense]
MYHSNLIISRIESDRALALKLDHAFTGVMEGVEQQFSTIGDGLKRLSYYASCLTDNYDDVCTRMASEDYRFLVGIAQLFKNKRVIYDIISSYIETLLKNKDPDTITRIQRILIGLDVRVSTGQLTKRGLIYSTTAAVCYSFNVNIAIDSALKRITTKLSTWAVGGLGLYGIVEHAAESANRLKMLATVYYELLYSKKLEMMFFLVEPIIKKSGHIKTLNSTNYQIAESIAKMVK